MRFFIIMMFFFSSIVYANISYTNISSDTPSDESVERLIKAKMTKEHFAHVFSNRIPQSIITIQIFPFIVSENDNKQALEQKLAMMLELNEKSQEMLQNEINTNPHWVEFIDKIHIQTEINRVKKLYNQEQVNALIEFYESPIGKSIALTESREDIAELSDDANINTIIDYVENYGKDISVNHDDTEDDRYGEELEKVYKNSPTVHYMFSEMHRITESLGYNSEPNPEF